MQVVLGASSVNSNGTVMSRVGSAAVAMAADAAGRPVLICCETFKFVAKVRHRRRPLWTRRPRRPHHALPLRDASAGRFCGDNGFMQSPLLMTAGG